MKNGVIFDSEIDIFNFQWYSIIIHFVWVNLAIQILNEKLMNMIQLLYFKAKTKLIYNKQLKAGARLPATIAII